MNIRTPKIERCCSYCREPGHIIRNGAAPTIHHLSGLLGELMVNYTIPQIKTALSGCQLRVLRMICVIIKKPISNRRDECIEIIMSEALIIKDLIEILPLLVSEMDGSLDTTPRKPEKIPITVLNLEDNAHPEYSADVDEACHECPICYDEYKIDKMLLTECGHSYCRDCITMHLNAGKECNCPLCRTEIKNLISKQYYSMNDGDIHNGCELILSS